MDDQTYNEIVTSTPEEPTQTLESVAPVTETPVTGHAHTIFNADATQFLSATSVIQASSNILPIQGSGGAVTLTSNPSIVQGINGQVVVLYGTDDTNTVTLTNGNGMRLNGNITLGENDTLTLMYDELDENMWIEVSRNLITSSAISSGSADNDTVLTADGSGNSSWKYPNILDTFTLGEDLSADDAVSLVPAMTVDQNYDETHLTDWFNMGDTSGYEYLGQQFTPSSTYCWKQGLYLRKRGTPTDNIIVKIYTNTSTLPDYLLATVPLDGATLTTDGAWYDLDISDVIYYSSAASYWIVISRDGGNDASNYYQWGYDKSTSSPAHSSSYGGGLMKVGSTVAGMSLTSGTSPYDDAIFRTYKEGTTAVIRKSRATSKFLSQNWIGFAVASGSTGETGIVSRFPSVSALSSLSPGRPYYLSDTAGAISSSKGTYPQQVGVAKSTTALSLSTVPPILAHIPRVGGQNTDVTINAGSATAFSTTIPGGTIPANGIMRITIIGTNDTANDLNLTTTLGGSTVGYCVVYGNGRVFRHTVEITNRGVTNSQLSFSLRNQTASALSNVDYTDTRTASLDTTGELALVITGGGVVGWAATISLIYIEVIA